MPIEPVAQPLVNALTTLGDLLLSQGEPEESAACWGEARSVVERTLGQAGMAQLERQRASSLTLQGRFREALQALDEAREFFLSDGRAVDLARVTVDRADLLHWLGDWERAAQELDEARSLVGARLQSPVASAGELLQGVGAGLAAILSGTGTVQDIEDSVALTRISVELDYYRGLIDKSRGEYAAAAEAFERVLPFYEQMGVGPAIRYQLSAIQLACGDPKACLDQLDQILPAFETDERLRPKRAAVLKLQGDALLALGRQHDALSKARAARRELIHVVDPDLLWRATFLEARALRSLDRLQEALNSTFPGG